MRFQQHVHQIFDEIQSVLRGIDRATVDRVVEQLMRAERVYVAGGGRSGLMARCFAMRLMHLGLHTYVVGETTTPAIRPNDCLVVCSASGQTQVVVLVSRAAKKVGAQVIAVTADPDSPIAKTADIVLVLDAPHKKAPDVGLPSVQYAGTLFEQSLLILSDAIAFEIGTQLGRSEEDMQQRHANLE
ncbi:MAG: 6-phospho-3-hexuloisomerase [Planctomycetes bacterium]|nr:6-phospho-3-hexuloisomerase [Planctomycetota bacterium]